MNSPIILITGASSGIGAEICRFFSSKGWNCILLARRKDKLSSLAEEVMRSYSNKVIWFSTNVTNKEDLQTVYHNLDPEWKNISVLVNNAGLALGKEPFDQGNLDDWDQMIDTNVKGMLYVSKIFLPSLIETKGHIVNIGSISSREVYPGGNIYCATKYAVDAITKSMRIDLLPHSVKVTGVYPGSVDTEFLNVRFKGDSQKILEFSNGIKVLDPIDVATCIFYSVTLPDHVCINDLTIMPSQQANNYVKKSIFNYPTPS